MIKEGKDPNTIYVTGNTAIDALKTTVKDNYHHDLLDWAFDSRLIMITAHRRENLGEPMRNMFRAIKRIIDKYPDIKAIYPIHIVFCNPKFLNWACGQNLGLNNKERRMSVCIRKKNVKKQSNFISNMASVEQM